MILLARTLVALAIGLVTGLFGFIATFFLVGYFGTCPPQVRTCDLPAIAGFGLGLIAGPILGLVAAWMSFRWLGRALGVAGRSHDSTI
jgi:hypothetical protein